MGVARRCHARHLFARAFVLTAFICMLSVVPPAFADGRAGTVPPKVAGPKVPTPTVVRELEASRTAESKTYLMSDGSFSQTIWTSPVHFRDSAKRWRDIDSTLVQTPRYGVSKVKASDYDIEVASSSATGTPVSIAHEGWRFGMKLLGGEQSALMALGNQAVYPLAMTDTSLVYEAGGSAVKDTLVLSSRRAPDTFTFHLSLDGLRLFQSVDGPGYTLVDARGRRAGRIEPLAVFDSSVNAAGQPAAQCESASVSVVPAEGGADVTYRVPRSWLDDPARVYPVKVDPEVVFSDRAETCDTFYSKGNGGTSFTTQNHLDVGKFSSSDYRRALVSFEMGSLPTGIRIDSAVLQMYCYSNTSGGSTTMNVYGVDTSWRGGSHYTWNNTFGNGYLRWNSLGDGVYSRWPGTGYVSFNPTAIVQSWYNGGNRSYPYGFLLMASGESGAPAKCFWSSRYSTHTARQPHLTVNYTMPWLSGALSGGSFAPSQNVTATVRLWAKGLSPNNAVTARIIGRNAQNADVDRGCFQWSADGGFSMDPDFGDEGKVELDENACSVTDDANGRTVNFVYRLGDAYGDVQNNRLMASAEGWSSTEALRDTGARYALLPAVTGPPSVGTTASGDWWSEANGPNNSAKAGRGSVSLTWAPAASASGYRVQLFDGNAWRNVATTTATTWTSAGKGVYPSDAAISNLSAGTTADPLLPGTGLDLRDDPRALYAKTAGTCWDSISAYALKIVPYNSVGSASPSDAATIPVSLDNRTRHIAEEPKHTQAELDDIAGDGATSLLDEGALGLSADDLGIKTWGPDAELSREYDSSDSFVGLFGAPGWRFSVERRLSVDATGATYIDEAGDAHRFRLVAGAYAPPVGLVATLAADTSVGGSSRSIRFKDRSKLYFDSQGRLVAESDNNGQRTSVAWAASSVTIQAANGQSIVLHTQDGRAASAEYSTQDGIRRVDYAWNASAGKATVSYSYSGPNAAQTATRCVEYLYSGGRITRIVLATRGGFAHLSGNARWDISYVSGRLAAVSAPTADGVSPCVTAISAQSGGDGSGSATLSRRGQVRGSDTTVTQSWSWNPDGSTSSRSNPKVVSEPTSTWRYTYSADGDQTSETDPLAASERSVFDSRGNEVYEIDALGQTTVNTYDDQDQLTSSTDPIGCVSRLHYNANGDVDRYERLLDEATGEIARTDYGYQVDGRMSFERQVLNADRDGVTHWLLAEYDYAGSTSAEPSMVVKRGQSQSASQKTSGAFSFEAIALGSGETSVTSAVSSSAEYDAFGNETKAIDALGNCETSVYDLEGRVLASTDGSRTLSVMRRYDAMGHEIATWQESKGAAIGYREVDVDALGRAVTERVYVTSGAIGTRQLHKTVTHSYDAMGREVSSDDSMVTGEPGRMQLDASGDVVRAWPEGLPSTRANDPGYATVSEFDALDRTTSVREPAADHPSRTAYDLAGRESTETAADGTVTLWRYDGTDNVVQESEISTSGAETMTRTTYDVGGRAIRVTDENGDVTTTSFDLADRQVAVKGPATPTSPIIYNALGWTISKTDADGIASAYSYDALGRLLAEAVGGDGDRKTSTTTYDATGRILTQTDSDGKCVETTYDDFGRAVDEAQTKPAGLIKRVRTSLDSLSRPVVTQELPSGVVTRSTYPSASQAGSSTVVATIYGGITTTLTVDSAGNESARVSAGEETTFKRSVECTDAAGRITKWSLGSGVAWSSTDYDDVGHVAAQDGSAFSADGAYVYAGLGGRKSADRLPLVSAAGGASEWAYEYTPDGRLKTAAAAGKVPERFAYDSAGRLTAYTVLTDRAGSSSSGMLEYEPASSRLTVRRSASGGLAETYGFDGQGNRISQRRSGDTSITCAYDGQNRLSKYTSAKDSISADYTYDASGQRTRSLVATAGAVTDTAWTYAGPLLLSVSATSCSGSTVSSWTITYLYDAEDKAYGGVYRSNAQSATPFCLVTTAHGDVIALTDAQGRSFASYRYGAFGRDLGVLAPGGGSVSAALASSIALRQPLRYAGYIFDAESSFYYLSARHYDPATFQFLQKDPAKADGEESAYQYCGGDPVGATDPSGMSMKLDTPEERKGHKKYRKEKAAKKKSKKHSRRSGGTRSSRRGGSHGKFNRGAKPAPRLHGATSENMIKMCKSQLGYREGPGNDTKYGAWYGSNYSPWCDMFISWCASKIGAGKIVHTESYTPSHAKWFYKRHRWGGTPKRGAIVFFNFGDSDWGGRWKGIHHVGIVEWVSKHNKIRTIEGNTNGGMVARRVRHSWEVAGYGYPAYK